jgi:hypothetical protein
MNLEFRELKAQKTDFRQALIPVIEISHKNISNTQLISLDSIQ